MKLWAKVKFDSKEDLSNLLKKFFSEFNPESKICVKGDEAELEIVFDKPSMEIVKAISDCNIIEFKYAKALDESGENEEASETIENENKEKVSEVITKKEKKEEVLKSTNQKKKKETLKQTETVTKITEKVEIPELAEIAKNSSSYEDFVKAVLEWLDFGGKTDMLAKIIKASEQIDTICWKNIKSKLTSKGISYAQNEDIGIASKFKKRFKDCEEPITPIPFIKALIAYKSFDFGDKEIIENEEPAEATAEITKETRPEITAEKSCLDEIFDSVNKNDFTEEKVMYILDSMGIEELDFVKQDMICSITNAAVRTREDGMNIDFIMENTDISPDKWMEARMAFSEFINDFVKKHNYDKKVKLLDFLIELRKAVIV